MSPRKYQLLYFGYEACKSKNTFARSKKKVITQLQHLKLFFSAFCVLVHIYELIRLKKACQTSSASP